MSHGYDGRVECLAMVSHGYGGRVECHLSAMAMVGGWSATYQPWLWWEGGVPLISHGCGGRVECLAMVGGWSATYESMRAMARRHNAI